MLGKNQIKEIRSLHLKKFRDVKKLFIVEGVKSISEVLEFNPSCLRQIYAGAEFIKSNSGKLKGGAIEVVEANPEELSMISLQSTPNQALAVCKYFDLPGTSFDFDSVFSFYLDDIRDPGNFGTILRLAAWYGVSKIFCSTNSCDLYNPKVIQSSMGAFLRVQAVYLPLTALISDTKVKTVYGSVLNGENLYKQKLRSGLIIIGNEANGISDENLKLATDLITIPPAKNSTAESLNAAMATAIIASEFHRQLHL